MTTRFIFYQILNLSMLSHTAIHISKNTKQSYRQKICFAAISSGQVAVHTLLQSCLLKRKMAHGVFAWITGPSTPSQSRTGSLFLLQVNSWMICVILSGSPGWTLPRDFTKLECRQLTSPKLPFALTTTTMNTTLCRLVYATLHQRFRRR